MLHELAHNVHGPHNEAFHALWDQERKEYEALISKGYTGEGFLSDGRQLGGRRIPMHEARRLARMAAEKRATLYSGSGQKLGGRPVRVGTDIRKVIVDAIERRSTVLKGCGSGNKDNDNEVEWLATRAVKDGVMTKAEEDEANDRAIAEAVWELIEEDQKKEYGGDYIPSTASNPIGNGGGSVGPSKPIKQEVSSSRPTSGPRSNTVPPIQPSKPIGRLVAEPTAKKPSPAASTSSVYNSSPPSPPIVTGWTCEICTLHNPINYLCCDACTTERPEKITKQIAEDARKKVAKTKPAGFNTTIWTCTKCTTVMEDKWWTCSTCGKMKESS